MAKKPTSKIGEKMKPKKTSAARPRKAAAPGKAAVIRSGTSGASSVPAQQSWKNPKLQAEFERLRALRSGKKPGVSRPSGRRTQDTGHRTQTRVSRKGFLKTAGLGAAAIGAAAAGLGGIAHTTGGSTTVNADDYTPGPDQVAAVQNAVDNYEIVNLQGIFDFGNSQVVLTRPGEVQILGPATILNGQDAFYCDTATVNVTIKNITFDGAKAAAVGIRTCAGATIADNTIMNLEPVSSVRIWPLANPYPPHTATNDHVAGISFGPKSENPAEGPGAMTHHLGTVVIENNFVDLGKYENGVLVDPNEGRPIDGPQVIVTGITVLLSNVELVVSGNTVKNCNRNGISLMDLWGTTVVENNTVALGHIPGYFNIPGASEPATYYSMIVGAGYIFPYNTKGKFIISNNDITVTAPLGIGLAVLGAYPWPGMPPDPAHSLENLVVTNNNIQMGPVPYQQIPQRYWIPGPSGPYPPPAHGAIGMVGLGMLLPSYPISNSILGSYVGQNRIKGEALLGILLHNCSESLFLGNNLDEFNPIQGFHAALFNQSNDTSIVGGSGVLFVDPAITGTRTTGDWTVVGGGAEGISGEILSEMLKGVNQP